jgi:hypothetical protein
MGARARPAKQRRRSYDRGQATGGRTDAVPTAAPLSAAEREAEREGERKLNAVLAEMFGPKESYGDSEVDAACAVLDAREQANG